MKPDAGGKSAHAVGLALGKARAALRAGARPRGSRQSRQTRPVLHPLPLVALPLVFAVFAVCAAVVINAPAGHPVRVQEAALAPSPPPATAAPTDPALAAPSDPAINAVTAGFMNFALNALLVPVLDVDDPIRWIDPTLAMACRDAAVAIDGAPLVAGAPVPAVAFTLRWTMDQCAPLGEHLLLSGIVDLVVFHDGDSYSAMVLPQALKVASNLGTDLLVAPFSARTTLQSD